jgi:mRNA interferase HigB
MNVISQKALRQFWEKHADAKDSLLVWYKLATKSNWASLVEIKEHYPDTDYVGNDRYVFNLKGNKYRLVVKIDFNAKLILIRFVGTHSEYNKIDASTE